MNKIPPKSRDNPVKILFLCFVIYVFFSLPMYTSNMNSFVREFAFVADREVIQYRAGAWKCHRSFPPDLSSAPVLDNISGRVGANLFCPLLGCGLACSRACNVIIYVARIIVFSTRAVFRVSCVTKQAFQFGFGGGQVPVLSSEGSSRKGHTLCVQYSSNRYSSVLVSVPPKTWRTFWIFFKFFFCSGRGKGESEAARRGG